MYGASSKIYDIKILLKRHSPSEEEYLVFRLIISFVKRSANLMREILKRKAGISPMALYNHIKPTACATNVRLSNF